MSETGVVETPFEPYEQGESGNAAPDVPPDIPPSALAARRAFRILLPIALVAVMAAVIVNWLLVPGLGEALPSPMLPADTVVSGVPAPDEPAAGATTMLPGRVIQFETLTAQPVPGNEDRAAEAVYKTLQMNIEAQVPTLVYARAEVLGSASEAERRLATLMAPYTEKAGQIMIGQTVAREGWMPDKSSYARGWTRGSSMTFVKASFAEWTPKDRFDFIEAQGVAVSEAIEVFQRTGLQGAAGVSGQ